MADVEFAKLDFEREKWLAEQGFRERELILRERAQANADAEVELKRLEHRQSRWRSPLVVGVFVAAAAALGNAVVAMVNGTLQRDLEREEAQDVDALERAKAEASRILEMIKTGDPETAAGNLQFLVDAGLVDDADRLKRLQAFLATRQPGKGPSLPAPTPEYRFERTEALTEQIAADIDRHLQEYIKYLSEVGLSVSQSQRVTIRIEDGLRNAYYSPSEQALVIGTEFAADPEAALREFSHHLLLQGNDLDVVTDEMRIIESGLADYLVCSFREDPALGEIIAEVLNAGPYLRNLDNQRSYAELADLETSVRLYQGTEIWGGAFWDMRRRLGKDIVDRTLVQAWLQAMATPQNQGAQTFVAALLQTAKEESEDAFNQMELVLRQRGFPLP